jgi:hypothetical protein
MKTAEEVYRQITGCIINHGNIKTAMIEFAKLHVEAALKAASEETKMLDDKECWRNCSCQQPCKIIDKNSILNSYPESNIK